MLDANFSIHECNQAFAQLLEGISDPQTVRECLDDNDASVIGELRLADGERWKGTLNMRVKGELRETEWQISPYRTPGSSLVFVEDVTEHRHRERSHQAQLDNATSQLAKEVAERARTEEQLLQAQKMDALGKLTGGIAHDFNNMLTGIITSLELIRKQASVQTSPKLQVYADAALNSATSAASLTHRLLAFARQQPLDTRPVDINEHVRSLEDLLIRTIGERIVLNLELTNQPAIAMVDPVQLESAVLNLVINARDALPQGGHIWISTYAAYSRGNPKMQDGAYVSLSVRDDGIGIDHNVIDKVFEPFFTTKPLGQGTGLGLSTIYGFARQSGGDAHIRSVMGRGTEVTLLLPAAGEVPDLPPEPRSSVDPQGQGEHILIVEDMASVRLFVSEVLLDAGYRCTTVESIELALEHLQKDASIDLLLTDVGLPRMSGRELADVARGWRAGLPVLFMTGYAQTALNRQAFLAPGMDMLFKPFQIGELLEKVRRVLGA